MSSVGNLLGITSTRDNDAARRATDVATRDGSTQIQQYNQGNVANQGLNSQIAGGQYYGTAGQVYAQQQNAVNMLQAQANGTAPSAAESMMGLGLSQANQQAQSAALSQQGGVMAGNTQRNLLNAQAMNGQNVLGQTAVIRAQEQAAGQQALAQSLNAMQGQQQQQGQLNYNQQLTGLQNSMALNQQGYQNGMDATNAMYGYKMNNINGQAAAAQAQASALGQTISGVAQAAMPASGILKAAQAAAPSTGGYVMPQPRVGY